MLVLRFYGSIVVVHGDFPSVRGMFYNHCTNKGLINPTITRIIIHEKKDRTVEIKLEFGGKRNPRSCALGATRIPLGSVVNGGRTWVSAPRVNQQNTTTFNKINIKKEKAE